MDVKEHLPACQFGTECFRTSQEHLSQFWHPPSKVDTCFKEPRIETSSSLQPDNTKSTTNGPGYIKKLVLLMLVGPPGSGKSTFCQKILRSAARPWTRICQDVISNGKRGSRVQCLKSAGNALSAGRNVLIDRCNIDVDQRKEFLQLAQERGVEAHALVINLPVTVCIQRASARTAHEGGLNGPGVGAVVNRVSRTRVPPTLGEGFLRITYCRTDTEIEDTVRLYSQLGPRHQLSSGVFGASAQEGKGTLRSFIDKTVTDVKSNTTSEQQIAETNAPSQRYLGPMSASWLSSTRDRRPNGYDRTTIEKVEEMTRSEKDTSEKLGARSLAFPSISTADFQFDHEMAATIIVETAVEFHNTDHAGLRLVFVDLSLNSDMLARVRKKAADAGLKSLQLVTHAGDITKLSTSGGPQCNIIANATNWRLRPGGGGVNAAIFKAAGAELEQATREAAKTLNPGESVAVALSESSPLRKDEGVTHVIHVLGPNMNPQRPNCLAGDYKQGCHILRATYSRLFKTFSRIIKDSASLVTNLPPVGNLTSKVGSNDIRSETRGDSEENNPPQALPTNAFTMLMQAAKRKGTGSLDLKTKRERSVDQHKMVDIESDKERGASTDMVVSSGPHVQESGCKDIGDIRPTRKWGTWAQALRDIALNPQASTNVLQTTAEAVVIPDMYAKGKKHLLVISRRDGLDAIDDVCMEHLPILEHLHSLGESWARVYLTEDPTLVFRLGYHWVPSMRQLHMHVISQDFDSPNLKNKKHWNSFTTGYFRDSQDILTEVAEIGQVRACSSEAEGKFLGMELRCHRCRCAQPNMPRLKAHIKTCRTVLLHPQLITSSSPEP